MRAPQRNPEGATGDGAAFVAIAQRQLNDSFRVLFEHCTEPMVITDGRTGAILEANGPASDLLGIARDDIAGRSVADFLPGGEEANTAFREARRGTGSARGETVIRPPGGKEFPISFWQVECIEHDGSLRLFIGFRDLRETEHLVRVEATLRALFDTSPDGKLVIGMDGNVRYVNQAYLDTWGYAEADIHRPIDERKARTRGILVNPAQLDDISRAVADPGYRDRLDVLDLRDGRSIEVQVSTVRDEAGSAIGVAFTTRDVTLAQRQRKQLADMAALLELLSRNSPQGIVISGVDGHLLHANERFMAIWGLDDSWRQLTPPERLTAMAARSADPGAFLAGSGGFCDPQPAEFWTETGLTSGTLVRFQAVPLRDEHRAVIGWAGFHTDVTEERRAEAVLRSSEDRYRTLVASVPTGVVLHDGDGRIIEANGAAERILGLTRDQLFGLTAFDPRWRTVHPDGRECLPEEFPSVVTRVTGAPQSNVLLGIEHTSGDRRWVVVNSSALKDPGGDLTGVVISFDDVTEQRQANELLVRARTAEALQSLAATVAHKINNSLTSIVGNAYLAGIPDVPGEEVDEALREITRASSDAAGLVRDLMALSGATEHPPEEANIATEVARVVSRLPGSSVVVEADAGLPVLRIDREGFQLALTNLLKNATEAASEVSVRSHLIETFLPAPGAEYAPIQPGPGRYLAVCVIDNGPGVPGELKGRIFDPFVRADFAGRGLGLAATAGAMARQGGFVELVSSSNGCRATLLLPVR